MSRAQEAQKGSGSCNGGCIDELVRLVDFPDRWVSIKNLDRSVTSSEIYNLCRPFGLICNLNGPRPTPDGKDRKALVFFFSFSAAVKTMNELNGVEVNGRRIKVERCQARQRKDRKRHNYPLPWSKTIEAANHYLGFNGWSTSVQECVEVGHTEVGAQGLYSSSWKATVELYYLESPAGKSDGPCQRISSHGIANTTEASRFEARERAKKQAILSATVNGLKCLKLVLFNDCCVHVQADSTNLEIFPDENDTNSRSCYKHLEDSGGDHFVDPAWLNDGDALSL